MDCIGNDDHYYVYLVFTDILSRKVDCVLVNDSKL